jgi:hypothetical protein
MSIAPVDPKYFQSLSGQFNCMFSCIAPEGTKLEHIFRAEFWSKVVATQACQGRLHVDDLIRIRSTDRVFDLFVTVSGFRKDESPLLVRFPNDPFSTAAAMNPRLPTPTVKMPKTLVEASEALGVPINATADDVRRAGQAMQAAWHPDHGVDDEDRRRRENRSQQVNAAIELLSGKRKVA